MHNSVWTETCSLPAFPRLDGDAETDVVIIGGGMAGLLTAYMMDRAGIDYLLLEADRICGGVTGNTTAKLTSQHGLIYHKLLHSFSPKTARMYWEAHEQALEQYRQLCRHIPCGFEEKAAYVYSLRKPARLKQELAALKRLGIPAEFAEDLPLPFPTAGAVRFPKQGQFHPLQFAAGLVPGLNIREGTTALSVRGGVVTTDGGTVRARRVIVTTHFPFLNRHGAYFLKLYQQRSYVLALEGAGAVHGMYVDASENGPSLRNHGGLLLVGGGTHRTGKPGGAWQELEAFARTNYPQAREAYRWAAQDCISLDGIPYIGLYGRNTQGLYAATGFNKWGMTSSMVAAMLLRDAVLGRKNPYAPVFDPHRTMLRPQLLANLGESTLNLLTPTAPRCPHLGCALKWNPHERSWDCPCHGSRFSQKGRRLENPAVKDLKQS